MINFINKHSKGFFAGIMLALTLGASAATFSVWSPGGGLDTTSTWNSQKLKLDAGPTLVLGTLPANRGGTGQATVTTGDLLYGSAADTWSKLADVATGNALISGGVGVAPSWGKVGLTTMVTGTLPVANGGTNLTGATDDQVMLGNGTTWISTAVPNCADTTGQHLNYLTASNAFSCGTTGVGGITGLANPTGTIGLTAVNGSATTALRSDGAPALSQSIAPTWTGAHLFNGATFSGTGTSGVTAGQNSNFGEVRWLSSTAPTGARGWTAYIEPTGGSWNLVTLDNTGTGVLSAITVTRSSTTPSVLLPAPTFHTGVAGTSVATSGSWAGQLGAGYPAYTWVASGAAANTRRWDAYVDSTSGTWSLATTTDAGSVTGFPIVVSRTTTTATSLALAATTVTVNAFAVPRTSMVFMTTSGPGTCTPNASVVRQNFGATCTSSGAGQFTISFSTAYVTLFPVCQASTVGAAVSVFFTSVSLTAISGQIFNPTTGAPTDGLVGVTCTGNS